MKKITKAYLVLTIFITIILLYFKFSQSGLERIEGFNHVPKSPFIYRYTKNCLNVLGASLDSSPSNWGQGLGIILSPFVILSFPAAFITDTFSFPYDYYLDKKITDKVMFWQKNLQLTKIRMNENITEQEEQLYRDNFNEYGALIIYKQYQPVGASFHGSRLLFFNELAVSHPEYKYSSKLSTRFYSDLNHASLETQNSVFEITLSDIDGYAGIISKLIRAPGYMSTTGFAKKYYEIIVSGTEIKKESKVQIIEALIYAHDLDFKNADYGRKHEKANEIKEALTILEGILEETKE